MIAYARLIPWALSAALLASSVALWGLYAAARDDLARVTDRLDAIQEVRGHEDEARAASDAALIDLLSGD